MWQPARLVLMASLLLVVALIGVALAGDPPLRSPRPSTAPRPPEAGGGACLLIPLDLEDLATRADRIVLARVGPQITRRDAETGVIWTDVSLHVEETWKGTAEARLGLTEPGGVLDGIGLTVSASVRYRTGERVVVFLHRDALGQPRTLGITQGRFLVSRGERVHLDGLIGDAARTAFPDSRGDVPLEVFRRAVASLAGTSEGGR